MFGFKWVITALWLSGSLRSFLYSFSMYPYHFLMSSVYVRSIPLLSFIMPIFIWNIPLKWTGVKVTQSCLTLWDPMDYRVHGILQARILEWVSFPFSRGSSQPRDQTQVSHIAGRFFTIWATREAHIPLVSLIFLKKSLVFNFCCFPPFLCIDRWERLSYLSLLFFGTLHSDGYIFPFLLKYYEGCGITNIW